MSKQAKAGARAYQVAERVTVTLPPTQQQKLRAVRAAYLHAMGLQEGEVEPDWPSNATLLSFALLRAHLLSE